MAWISQYSKGFVILYILLISMITNYAYDAMILITIVH